MSFRSLSRAVLPTIAATVLATTAACASSADGRPVGSAGYHGVMLPAPVAKPDFTLTRTDGSPYAFRAETDSAAVTLLFFGYASCPDVCPVQMANIARVLDRMSYEDAHRVQVVFVTVDPERDTPAKLRAWLDQFDPRFVGLTGDSTALRDAQLSLGITPATRDSAGGAAGYSVSHAAQVYAFTADQQAHLVYPFGTRQTDWAQDLPRLVHERWGAGAPRPDGAVTGTATRGSTDR